MFDISSLTNGGTSIKALSGANTGVVELGANTLTVTNATNGAFAGVIQGSGGVTLSAGTQVFSGANTYTGNTNVNGGTLVVDGSTASSLLTTVNPGGTLAGSGTVGTTEITGGTLAPGSAGGSVFGPLTVAGSLSFTAASTYLVQVSPAICSHDHRGGSGESRRRAGQRGVPARQLRRQAIHHPHRHRRTRQHHVQSDGAFQQCEPERDALLRPDQRIPQHQAQLRHADRPADHQPAECRQRADELLHHHRRHPGRVRLAQCPGPHHRLRRTRHRHHPVRDQGRRLLPQPAARSHHRRPRRRLCRRSASTTGFADEDDEALAYAKKRLATRSERDAYAMATQGAGSALGAACEPLERLGRRLWRLRQYRRQCRRWIEQRHRTRLGRRRRRRLQGHAQTPCSALRSPAAAPITRWRTALAADRPTCSRPAPSAGTTLDRPISPARSITAGTTSPPTAP